MAGIHRNTVYARARSDEAFAQLLNEALELSVTSLEREARRRAVDGTLKPVFQKGECVGYIREYSDTLLIFLMKGRAPEKYRENVKIEHAGSIEHEHTGEIKVKVMTEQERESEIERLLERRRERTSTAIAERN